MIQFRKLGDLATIVNNQVWNIQLLAAYGSAFFILMGCTIGSGYYDKINKRMKTKADHYKRV